MGIEIGIAAVGAGLAGAGMYRQRQGAKKQQAAQDEQLRIQERQEQLRRQQMELEAQRRQRELVRTQIQQRSFALATAEAQGAAGGSALEGAFGQISGRTNVNAQGIQQNLEIGRSMFGSNVDMLGAYRMAAQGQSMSAAGQGLMNLGTNVMSFSGTLGKFFGGTGQSGPMTVYGSHGDYGVPTFGAE